MLVTSHIQLFVTPWTVTCQAPLSMGFFRQEYWSGLPCPPPGDLPDPGIKPGSPALQSDSLPSKPPGKAIILQLKINKIKCLVFFNGNLLMFWLLGFCYKNPYPSWLLPYVFGALPQSDLRGHLTGLSPQKICQIKHNSQCLGGAFFFPSQQNSISRRMVFHWQKTSFHPNFKP